MIKIGALVKIKRSYFMDTDFSSISLDKKRSPDDLLLVLKHTGSSPEGECYQILLPYGNIFTWPEDALEVIQ